MPACIYPKDFQSYIGRGYVHAAHYRRPQSGDLVLCQTGRIDEWKVSWFVCWEAEEHGIAILREIGSKRECRYGNESFLPIAGLMPDELLEGDRLRFYRKVILAFRRGDEYLYRYGGLEFTAKHGARIWIREPFGGLNQDSVPFAVDMHWTTKTSAAAVLRAMRSAGYGTRRFEHKERPEEK